MERDSYHTGVIGMELKPVIKNRVAAVLIGILLLVGTVAAIPAPVPEVPTTLQTELTAVLWNPIEMMPILLQPFTYPFGDDGFLIVTGLITFVFFIGIWIRTESGLLASTVFIIWADWQGISTFCPTDWQLAAIILLVVLPFIAVLYSVWKFRG